MNSPLKTDIAAYIQRVADAPVLLMEQDEQRIVTASGHAYIYADTVEGTYGHEVQQHLVHLHQIEAKWAGPFVTTAEPLPAELVMIFGLLPANEAARAACHSYLTVELTSADFLAAAEALTYDDTKLSAEMNAKLDALSAALPYPAPESSWRSGMQASYDGLNGLAFAVLSQNHCTMTGEERALLLAAYQELGITTIERASDAELLAMMDAFAGVEFGSALERKLTAYGIALAYAAGNAGVALTIADGRPGAGIGWDLTRQELGADLAA